MSSDLVSRLPSIYRNAHDIKNKSSTPSRGHLPPPDPQGTSGKALDSSWPLNRSVTLGKSVLLLVKHSW